MTPTALRALAARVLAEEPSRELRDAIEDALGTARFIFDDNGKGRRRESPNPLTSHDAAFGVMPAGWMLVITTGPGKNCTVDAAWDYGDGPEPDPETWRTACAEAPTLPRALTAAGLLARAVDAENKETSDG